MRTMRPWVYPFLTFCGVLTSLAVAAKISEMTGFLDLVGFTLDGVLQGGACLAVAGIFSTLYLARDIAVWSLAALSLEEWAQEHPQVDFDGIKAVWADALVKCQWRWSTPRLYIYPAKELNAVAISVGRGRSLVLLSSGLLEQGRNEGVEAALIYSLMRLKSGEMTGLIVMFGMMIPMTLFPARMMALLLGTSLRSAEEETPSDIVETSMVIMLEAFFVLCGSLMTSQFTRSGADKTDRQLLGSSVQADFERLLELDAAQRTERHRERFTAPFCMFDKGGTYGLTWLHSLRSSKVRRKRLTSASGVSSEGGR